ncbi:MAG: excinuclease ABC subunit UvrA [Candidatus Omnitrophica bacterium]|nr:excinuclease ABC subunit UvrA [Candidatus Omnitrophota bacterium]
MNAISARGVRVHNLKNIDVTIPHRKLVIITGVSGSGKSSLAFDTLYAEGQRRYIESMSSYTRQFLERMEKPDADSITGMLPAIAIESKNFISNARSTVGTQTELNDFMRLLFARAGQTVCRQCGQPVKKEPAGEVAKGLLERLSGQTVLINFEIPLEAKAKKYLKEALEELSKQGFTRLYDKNAVKSLDEVRISSLKSLERITVVVDRIPIKPDSKPRITESLETAYHHGRGQLVVVTDGAEERHSEHFHCAKCILNYPLPTPHMFSFNSPLGACPACQGFGRVIVIDMNLVVPDPSKSLAGGAIEPWTKPSAHWEFYQLKKFCQKTGIPFDRPWNKLTQKQRDVVLNGGGDYFGVKDFFEYLQKKTYKMHVRVFLAKYRSFVPCEQCKGLRLKQEALCVYVGGKNIAEISELTIHEAKQFFGGPSLPDFEKSAAEPVLFEIRNRLAFLDEVGLGYLTLNRSSRTLSGGEAQRIHLATSLGSALVDTLYVLDEPSIGLHERDNLLLIGLLRKLRDLGNSVVVVEHDKAMIEAGDEIIDMGLHAGKDGGEVIFQGAIPDLLNDSRSITGAYLSGREKIAIRSNGRKLAAGKRKIVLEGAAEHNLKNIRAEIPLGKFCVLTGVSGSGKSTLLYDILYKNYLRFRGRPVKEIGRLEKAFGFELIDDMILIDQSPIGRTPRSNPATYSGMFDEIRQVFARTKEARQKKMTAGSFSFNVDRGRCQKCKGDGKVKVEMHFLADIFIDCDTCNGTRYQEHVLNVFFRGKNIHQVLNLTVREAMDFFAYQEGIQSKLRVLDDVGLGYLRLGQSANTLSSGEAQRLKLSQHLIERPQQKLLYLFDEPTTGLHYNDIRYLMGAFERLLQGGHSILIIEHNMEVIKCADWIIDLGPEAGEKGGSVVAVGTPSEIAGIQNSHTGQCLKSYLSFPN